MRAVQFYRHITKFHGGHLKVFDYFNHVASHPDFEAQIEFTPETVWDENNPWAGDGAGVQALGANRGADVFFLAGTDWEYAESHPSFAPEVPVINFIQHVRHADPESPRHQFIGRRAIRVCVSEVVADAVRATGKAGEPVLFIPNCTDLEGLPSAHPSDQDIDVLIAGLKRPKKASKLEARLARDGRTVVALTGRLPREEYLDRVRRARVTVFLPNPSEGFYLPPLEGMAIGTLVVCPEHDGEHKIYEDGVNCFRPTADLDDLSAAAEAALALTKDEAAAMRGAAKTTAEGRSMPVERREMHSILDRLDELWAEARPGR